MMKMMRMMMMMMIIEEKFLLASTIILVTADMSVGTRTGRLFIHMCAWSPVLMIQIMDYVIIIMRTVSHRVSFHCLLLQGNKGSFRKPLPNLQNRANTPEEKYHRGLRKPNVRIRVGNTKRFSKRKERADSSFLSLKINYLKTESQVEE